MGRNLSQLGHHPSFLNCYESVNSCRPLSLSFFEAHITILFVAKFINRGLPFSPIYVYKHMIIIKLTIEFQMVNVF